MGIRAGHSGRRPAGYYDQCVENRSFCNVVNLRFYQVQTCEILPSFKFASFKFADKFRAIQKSSDAALRPTECKG